MNSKLAVQTLESVEAAGHALKAASDLLDAADQEKQAATALIGPAVDSLQSQQLIPESQANMARTKLASHDGALEVVSNLVTEIGKIHAGYRQKLAAAGQGTPVSEKTAGFVGDGTTEATGTLTSNGAPIVGRPAGLGERRAADVKFAQAFGVDVG